MVSFHLSPPFWENMFWNFSKHSVCSPKISGPVLLLENPRMPVEKMLANNLVYLLLPIVLPYMGVSKNRGTSKWMVYNGKPY